MNVDWNWLQRHICSSCSWGQCELPKLNANMQVLLKFQHTWKSLKEWKKYMYIDKIYNNESKKISSGTDIHTIAHFPFAPEKHRVLMNWLCVSVFVFVFFFISVRLTITPQACIIDTPNWINEITLQVAMDKHVIIVQTLYHLLKKQDLIFLPQITIAHWVLPVTTHRYCVSPLLPDWGNSPFS